MREIKFRAWDKESEEMIYNVQNGNSGWHLGDFLADELYVVMQYTGLKDKNGRDIYEGDIVYINITPSCERPIAKNCKVWYSEKDAAFMCDWHSGATHLGGFTPITVFEVIGNIYENPELLQQ